jgi:hypothetical protein
MAFEPPEIFANWSENGTNVTLPLASVLDLTAALADATTGDGRQVAWALTKTIFDWYNEATPKPVGIEVKYSPGSIQSSGDYIGKQKASITLTAYLDFPEGTVAAEV